MSRFRDRMTRFFRGRYARNDQLYHALFLIVIVLLFLGAIFALLGTGTQLLSLRVISWVLYVISVGLLFWSIFRFLSRNIAARQRENAAWLRLWARIRHPFRGGHRRPADTATHVFRSCPACRATLRLPRQPGKHTAKCPRCGKPFPVNIKK